jgi:hypothetical protein
MTVEPCEHVVSLLRSVSDGLAACSRCKIYAQKTAGVIRASRVPFPSSTPGKLQTRKSLVPNP